MPGRVKLSSLATTELLYVGNPQPKRRPSQPSPDSPVLKRRRETAAPAPVVEEPLPSEEPVSPLLPAEEAAAIDQDAEYEDDIEETVDPLLLRSPGVENAIDPKSAQAVNPAAERSTGDDPAEAVDSADGVNGTAGVSADAGQESDTAKEPEPALESGVSVKKPTRMSAKKEPKKEPRSAATSRASSPQAGGVRKKTASSARSKKYTCKEEGCGKSFTRPCRLEEHLRSHTGVRPFKCTADPEKCDKSFLRDSHLKAHVRAMHDKIKPYKCTFMIPAGTEQDRGIFGFKRKASAPIEDGSVAPGEQRECGATFSTNQHLKRHVDSHTKTYPYICNDYPPCVAGFRKRGQFMRHIRAEHLNLLPFACSKPSTTNPTETCTAAFDTKGKLGNHVTMVHSGMAKRRYLCIECPASSVKKVTASEIPSEESLKPETPKDPASLLQNLSSDSPPGASLTEPPADHKAASPQEPMFVARAEDMLSFTSYREFRQHQKTAHPPVCQLCQRTFVKDRSLQSHLLEVHGASLDERRRFVCETPGCGSRFTKKHALKKHVETAHLGLRPFACTAPGCNKSFAHKQWLQKHHARHHDAAAPPPPPRRPRRALTTRPGVLEELVGAGYEDTGRHIKCVLGDCPHRCARWYDMARHLGAAGSGGHALSQAQVEDLVGDMMRREKEEGDGVAATGSETSDEEDYWTERESGSETESDDGEEDEDEDDD